MFIKNTQLKDDKKPQGTWFIFLFVELERVSGHRVISGNSFFTNKKNMIKICPFPFRSLLANNSPKVMNKDTSRELIDIVSGSLFLNLK